MQLRLLTASVIFAIHVYLGACMANGLTRSLPVASATRGFETFSAKEAPILIDSSQIEGRIPKCISGSLYLIGPGRNEINGESYSHWFDGDGLLTKIDIDAEANDEKISLLSRFLRTPRFIKQASSTKAFPDTGGWTPKGGKNGGFFEKLFPNITNPANTNIMMLNNRLFALFDGFTPLEVDPNTLETKSDYDFDGTLTSVFAAHPKFDPITGDMYNFGLSRTGKLEINLIKQGKVGKLQQTIIPMPSDNFCPIHDFGLTEKYMVLPIIPFTMAIKDLILWLFGILSFGDCLKWKPQDKSKFIVVDRCTMAVKSIVETPGFSGFHYQAQDNTDGTVSVYVAQHRSDRNLLENYFSNILTQELTPELTCDFMEYNLDVDNAVLKSCARVSPNSRGMDVPTINPQKTAQSFTYIYSPCISTKSGYLDGYQKINVRTGEVTFFDQPAGSYSNEILFVPNENSVEEDDGYLLSTVYNSNRHCNELLVIDAKTMTFVARAKFPHHIPYGFHGLFLKKQL